MGCSLKMVSWASGEGFICSHGPKISLHNLANRYPPIRLATRPSHVRLARNWNSLAASEGIRDNYREVVLELASLRFASPTRWAYLDAAQYETNLEAGGGVVLFWDM